MYNEICPKDTLKELLHGKSAGIISYGQSGSGKTYTLFGKGKPETGSSLTKGIVPRAIVDIIKMMQNENINYNIFVSLYEVYVDIIRDLAVMGTDDQKKSSIFIK